MRPACKWRPPALPVLADPKVRSAPVLGTRLVWSLRARLGLRLGLTRISAQLCFLASSSFQGQIDHPD
ncbi:hypothetical protein B5V02_12480 [Mesorhizobium kowhaii]|uniref:Uncharacterized protein n=1 Tax=Mesorhizobium kowhaii TaxID=1300272 RepID=A0A2W7C5K7_9HYPH|nr:hypothetical protein B5V02_12480 [Mesorhizobium kowhaii]